MRRLLVHQPPTVNCLWRETTMAALRTRVGCLLQGFFSSSKIPRSSFDIRFDGCVTQVRFKGGPATPRFRHPVWHVRKERAHYPENLTAENKEFIRETISQDFGPPIVAHGVKTYDSPLKNIEKIEPVQWFPGIRRTSTIAKKIGIQPLWLNDGTRVMTTLLQIVDNHVIKYNPPDQVIPLRRRHKVIPKKVLGKFGALIVGAESADPQEFTKNYCGLFRESGLPPKRKLARFLISPEAVLPSGTPLNAMHYRVGDYIDATGFTIQRGFQGVMKRWGFKGQPATHGQTKTHRRPGSIGGGAGHRVWPGKKMPGHMGGRHRTLRALKILRINTEYNVLYVTGQNIPGQINSYIYVHDSLSHHRWVKDAKDAWPLPTYIPTETEVPENLYASDVHPFDAPSITYEIVDTPVVRTGAKIAKAKGSKK
ncbi:39S ribosomal protein L3, mitochondrial [Frankliniella occidentalis]|uniref:Large ribosomal subunit protein uL3m n=1 Tax=Frankliniella occidentalis TaxID=133901 RepID=A0A6J1SNT7_FRAOC|nr:39S ribosomal protein L3, mitochondrial [Frankliniella occidentalis]